MSLLTVKIYIYKFQEKKWNQIQLSLTNLPKVLRPKHIKNGKKRTSFDSAVLLTPPRLKNKLFRRVRNYLRKQLKIWNCAPRADVKWRKKLCSKISWDYLFEIACGSYSRHMRLDMSDLILYHQLLEHRVRVPCFSHVGRENPCSNLVWQKKALHCLRHCSGRCAQIHTEKV